MPGLTNKLNYFNPLYPSLSTGDAFVENVGSQWLIYNTHYTDNVAESAGITLNASSDFSSLEIPTLNANMMALVNDNSSSLASCWTTTPRTVKPTC